MTTTLAPSAPSLIDANGEIVALALEPISAERAGALLPQVIELSRTVARYRGFLEQVLTDSMTEAGQTEKRVGDTVYQLKGDSVWTVTDEQALARVLRDALDAGELTPEEVAAAVSERIVLSFHQGRLTTLAKRVPAIEQYRSHSESAPKLRVK